VATTDYLQGLGFLPGVPNVDQMGFGSNFPGMGPGFEPLIAFGQAQPPSQPMPMAGLFANSFAMPQMPPQFQMPPMQMPQMGGFGGFGGQSSGGFGGFGGQMPGLGGGGGFGGAMPQMPGGFGGGQQFGGGGMPQMPQMPGYSPAAQRSRQQAPQGYGQQMPAGYGGYSGGTSNPGNLGGQPPPQGMGGSGRMPFSIPSGGVYGQQKWLPGSTGADIFLPRGSPVTANQGGEVLLASSGNSSPMGAPPGEMIVRFDDGTSVRFRHVQPMARGRFQAGSPLATVNDGGMDILNRQVAASIGAPDGYQHLDLSVNRPGNTMFSPQGGGGGDIPAGQWLQQMGYQGRMVSRTPGPQEGMGGGGMGGGMPGMGGFPGMPGFGGGMSPFGGGGGFGGGFPGMPPMGGGFPGMGGMPAMPQMPMMPGMGGMGGFGGMRF
jgi:hypothetical protein